MTPCAQRLLGLAPLALVLACCTPPAGPQAGGDAPPAAASEEIALEGRTLVFVPSRDDFTVGKALLTVYCSRPTSVRIDGKEPQRSWTYIELERVARNRFRLPPLTVRFPEDYTGTICMSVKVWFEEVGNDFDSFFYVNGEDRYALVSFSTRPDGPDWAEAAPRFSQNRVPTLERFREALSRPFPIRLNGRPLSDLEALRR